MWKIGVVEPIALSNKRFCIWERFNDSQREQWIRAIEVFDEERGALEQLKLFAAERRLQRAASDRVEV